MAGRRRPWRLLPERAKHAHADELIRHATMASGVRAVIRTDASSLRLDLALAHDGPLTLDVLVDGALWQRFALTSGERTVAADLPDGEHEVQVWLPHVGQVWVGTLVLDDATVAQVPPTPGTRWIAYGSSITHGLDADGPSEIWPTIAARRLGWDMLSLGLGGQCHLDPIARRTIAAQAADVVSLCVGINIYSGSTYSRRTLAAHVSDFVEQLRTALPSAPLVVMTPIASPPRESEPNAVGLTLSAVREQVAHAVQVLQREDDHLYLIDGLMVLGPDHAHLLPDGLHPGSAGHRLIGQRVAARLTQLTARSSR